MAEQSFVSSTTEKSSNLLWYILGGVVALALVLGGVVWWYTNNLVSEAPPKRVLPTATPLATVAPTASASAVPVGINVVTESKSIVFPKDGRVVLYFLFFGMGPDSDPYTVDLITTKANVSVSVPSGVGETGPKMQVVDTGLDVKAGEAVAIQPYDLSNYQKPSYGWIKPADPTTCGAPGHLTSKPEVFNWMRTTIAATGEPIVSEQCWADWGSQSDLDFNDFLMVFTYAKPGTAVAAASPTTTATATPTPTPTATATPTSTPTPTPTPTPTATATPTATPTGTPTATPATPTPTVASTPRTATVDTSDGVPVTGVIEDTLKGLGVGVGLLILGLLLL